MLLFCNALTLNFNVFERFGNQFEKEIESMHHIKAWGKRVLKMILF